MNSHRFYGLALALGLTFPVLLATGSPAAFAERPMAATATNGCNEVLTGTPVNQGRFTEDRLKSKTLSQLNLTRYKAGLVEVPEVQVRQQDCFKSCYFEAGHTHTEIAMKNLGVLPKGAALAGFVTQMKIAKSRFRQRGTADLWTLLQGGFIHNEWMMTKGLTYVLPADQMQLVGGPKRFLELEYELRWEMAQRSYLKRAESERLYLLSDAQFIEEMRTIEEAYLSRMSRRPIKLQAMKIDEIELQRFTRYRFDDEQFYTQSTRLASKLSGFDGFANEETARGYEVESFESVVAPAVMKSIREGQPVLLSLRYFRGPEVRYHAINITGYMTDPTGKLAGFKYLDSFGQKARDQGFGFISVDDLAFNFDDMHIVKAVRLKPALSTATANG